MSVEGSAPNNASVLSLSEAVQFAGVSPGTVVGCVNAGKLPVIWRGATSSSCGTAAACGAARVASIRGFMGMTEPSPARAGGRTGPAARSGASPGSPPRAAATR
jgi:hypothetical protein